MNTWFYKTGDSIYIVTEETMDHALHRLRTIHRVNVTRHDLQLVTTHKPASHRVEKVVEGFQMISHPDCRE